MPSQTLCCMACSPPGPIRTLGRLRPKSPKRGGQAAGEFHERNKDGPALYPAATSGNGRKVTWNTHPARTGPVAADVGAVSAGTWVAFDVTALVVGNGTYAFDLAGPSADETVFASRETRVKSQRPQ